MAYIYAPTIDNTVTAYDIDNSSVFDTSNADTVLNISFFLNNPVDNVMEYVLVRIEDAYGNSWFSGTSSVHAFTYEPDELLSTIYNVDTGIDTRQNIQIPVSMLKQQQFAVGDYCHVFFKLIDKQSALSMDTAWDAWLKETSGNQSAWSEASVRYFIKTPILEFKQKQSRLWQYIGTSQLQRFEVPTRYQLFYDNAVNVKHYEAGEKLPETFIAYDYQYSEDKNEIVPVLYATNLNKYPETPAQNQRYYYDGEFTWEARKYDRWHQIEDGNSEYTWDSEFKTYILTDPIVTDNQIHHTSTSPLQIFNDARPLLRVEFAYADRLETDTIEWCSFHIQQNGSSSPIESGRLYPVAKNRIEWQLSEPIIGTGTIAYTYKTKKGFVKIVSTSSEEVLVYRMQDNAIIAGLTVSEITHSVDRGNVKFNVALSAWPDDLLKITFNLERAQQGSDDWEQVFQKDVAAASLSNKTFSIIDKTCQLGVSYQYRYFWSTSTGNSSESTVITADSNSIMCLSEDILLTTKDKEVVVRLNPELTGLKYNFKDAITPTLGKRYPFMYRNRKQNYRTFTLGGMISYEAQSGWSCPEWVATSDASTRDKQIITERIFRDELLRFLEAGDVILFRSMQEGNMFIHLSNISLKSEKALGRMIYSFSATATEVCEANTDNYLKYFKEDNIDTPVAGRILYAKGTSAINHTLTTTSSEIDTLNDNKWALYHEYVQE